MPAGERLAFPAPSWYDGAASMNEGNPPAPTVREETHSCGDGIVLHPYAIHLSGWYDGVRGDVSFMIEVEARDPSRGGIMRIAASLVVTICFIPSVLQAQDLSTFTTREAFEAALASERGLLLEVLGFDELDRGTELDDEYAAQGVRFSSVTRLVVDASGSGTPPTSPPNAINIPDSTCSQTGFIDQFEVVFDPPVKGAALDLLDIGLNNSARIDVYVGETSQGFMQSPSGEDRSFRFFGVVSNGDPITRIVGVCGLNCVSDGFGFDEFTYSRPDGDEDGVADAEDNCPEDPNENQSDQDLDGAGDVCDCAPTDANLQTDCGCGGVTSRIGAIRWNHPISLPTFLLLFVPILLFRRKPSSPRRGG